jgi:hypothetical protein
MRRRIDARHRDGTLTHVESAEEAEVSAMSGERIHARGKITAQNVRVNGGTV